MTPLTELGEVWSSLRWVSCLVSVWTAARAFVLAFGGLAGTAGFFIVERNPERTVAITAVLRWVTESHSCGVRASHNRNNKRTKKGRCSHTRGAFAHDGIAGKTRWVIGGGVAVIEHQ